MVPAADLDDLLANAVGRYLSGPCSLSFIVDPGLVGVMVWGRPGADEIIALMRAHERMRPVLAPRTAALVDVRHLQWPDPSAFAAVARYISERSAWLAEYIERLAVVHPYLGPVGAAGAGFFDVSARPFAVDTFTGLRDALAWLGRGDATELETELQTLLAEATGTPAILRRLRELLEASPGRLPLPRAARALRTTERSLQRALQSSSTTFQSEQGHAQVRAAQRRLVESDASIAQIAGEVGCKSLSHFSALFRRLTGETPSEWRRQRR